MFEILEHTADIGLRAWGGTQREMASEASRGLTAIVMDASRAKAAVEWEVSAAGEDQEALLVNWLSEILYLLDATGVAIHSVDVADWEMASNGEWRGRGVVRGEPRREEEHPARLIVKGITWHQLQVRKTGEGWCAEVYLDV